MSSLGTDLGLNAAAFHGHWRLCQFLIEQGADANARLADTGETPLHAALSKAGRLSTHAVAAVLLGAGADPNAATAMGVETGSFMRDCRTRGETPLHRAAAFATEETVEMLLKAGADPTLKDGHGDTPIGWASWHLRPAGVLRLLGHGSQTIHPAAAWTGDHGAGWCGMDVHLLGRPHLASAP